MPPSRPLALLWPPLWYYTSVPADLTETGGFLAARGVPVRAWDLSAGLSHHLLGASPAFQALRRRETYLDPPAHQAAVASFERAGLEISRRHRVRYGLRSLTFPDIDEAHVAGAWKVGLDPRRNPALAYLRRAAGQILADQPALIAIGLGYPEQRVQALTLGRLLRELGHRGPVVLYGSLQDEIAPEDFADDLVGAPRHLIFRDIDGVILGEAESALLALWQEATGQARPASIPNLLRPGGARPIRHTEDLATLPPASFELVDPEIYCTPTPVVDLRLGRGCPWGRCAFCAIQAHQPGYRASPAQRVAESMMAAHTRLGTRYFRIRDDLVTPRQLRELAAAIAALPFRPRWSARVRFEEALGLDTLRLARAAGLDELWIGLESASARVRATMDKGVAQATIHRVLDDASALGIRLRLLCMLGFPGERLEEAAQTVDLLLARRARIAAASISPFQLMRRSPMAAEPDKHGLQLLPDSLPRSARLRFTLPATWPGRFSREELAPLARRIEQELLPSLKRELVPDAAHGWIAATAAEDQASGAPG